MIPLSCSVLLWNLVWVIALSLSQLPGEGVLLGTEFCWQLARTADNLELRFRVTNGPFGDKPELLKPVAIFLPVFNVYLSFHIKQCA